ncbi:hypothetical protein M8494_03030 [Serratia ureilytica]
MLCVSPSHPFAAQKKPVCKKQRLNDIVVAIADSSHELPKRNHGTLPLQRQLVVCDVEATWRCSNAASATLSAAVADRKGTGQRRTGDGTRWRYKGRRNDLAGVASGQQGRGFNWWHERLTRKAMFTA